MSDPRRPHGRPWTGIEAPDATVGQPAPSAPPWELPGYWPEPEDAHEERGNVSASTSIERSFSGPSTELGAVVPIVFGTKKVSALGRLLHYEEKMPAEHDCLRLGLVLCHMECQAVNDLSLNGIPADDFEAGEWMIEYNIHLGTLTQTVDDILDEIGGDSPHVEEWPGFCYVAVRGDAQADDIPGQVEAIGEIVGANQIEVIGGGSPAYSANPILQVCCILTFGEPWLDSYTWAEIDSTSAAACVSWCNAVMGDDTKRFESHLVIRERDPWAVIANILTGCHCHIVAYRDKLHFWHEGSKTASGVTISADDWVDGPPAWRPVPVRTRASAMRVRYYLGSGFEQSHVDVGDDVSSAKRVEVNLETATNVSQARRWGEIELERAATQGGAWEGAVSRVVADLLPGDRCSAVMYPGGATEDCRVRLVNDNEDGTYWVRLTPYTDLDTKAALTASESAPPSRREAFS